MSDRPGYHKTANGLWRPNAVENAPAKTNVRKMGVKTAPVSELFDELNKAREQSSKREQVKTSYMNKNIDKILSNHTNLGLTPPVVDKKVLFNMEKRFETVDIPTPTFSPKSFTAEDLEEISKLRESGKMTVRQYLDIVSPLPDDLQEEPAREIPKPHLNMGRAAKTGLRK